MHVIVLPHHTADADKEHGAATCYKYKKCFRFHRCTLLSLLGTTSGPAGHVACGLDVCGMILESEKASVSIRFALKASQKNSPHWSATANRANADAPSITILPTLRPTMANTPDIPSQKARITTTG